MYTKDKVTRITLRLNEKQFDYVKTSADVLGVSPSEFLRMVVNLTMTADNAAQNSIREKMRKEEESRRENETSDINNRV